MTAPLYMTPPNTPAVRAEIRAGRLGAIVTPAQGNKLEEGWTWCGDNGVFQKREQGGAYPGDDAFLAWLDKLKPFQETCLFVVAPDVPKNAFKTALRSYEMLQRIRDKGYPAALAGQDFTEFCNWWSWDDFDCLFIGGSTEWKLSDAAASLAQDARANGKHVHAGRVNSGIRAAHFRDLADSYDGTTMAIAPDKNLGKVIGWRNAALYDSPMFHHDVEYDPHDGGYDLKNWTWKDAPPPPRPQRRTLHVPGQTDLLDAYDDESVPRQQLTLV
ncbi:hypothetical protein [Nonomuraea bangladeshensis]|uniref:hypothetical protein n=1 Tax=Nonomuraea bangladeshensis TaxID=404385 RepID=UPI003C2DCE03